MVRAVFQILAFGANLWALVSVLRSQSSPTRRRSGTDRFASHLWGRIAIGRELLCLEEEVKTEKANSYRTPLVVTFAEAATLDHTELGAKAANLARLASVGFPVPPGFAVTTTAERHQREVSAKILEAAAALSSSRSAPPAPPRTSKAPRSPGSTRPSWTSASMIFRRRSDGSSTLPALLGCPPIGTLAQSSRARPLLAWRCSCRSWWGPTRLESPSPPTP